jgi:outer membrane protein OmpA-like peptidoglycan-associated protein
MKWSWACCAALAGCTLQQAELPTQQSAARAPLPLGIVQSSHGPAAVFRLCSDCPTPTRKVLAAPPPPIRLTEVPKPKPPLPPRQEHITRAVHFPFASARLTTQARQVLDTLKALLPEARTITLTGNTDRVGTPAFNQRLAVRRAETIRQALLDMGVPADRIAPVEARCCVDDPPRTNPSARRTDLELLIVRPAS